MDLEVQEYFKKNNMGKYYENLNDLIGLIKKLEKNHTLAELILECIIITKLNPEKSPHEIIKEAKKKWYK